MTPPRLSDAFSRTMDIYGRALAEVARPAPVAPGVDRTGAPPMHGPAGLAQAEQNAWRRFSPRRNRWKDVARFDHAAELEQRQADGSRRLNDLQAAAANALVADADALAAWQLNPKGARPEPTAKPTPTEPALREQIEDLQRESDSLTRATTVVLTEEAEYVAKHRDRLAKDAHRAVQAQSARLLTTIDSSSANARTSRTSAKQSSGWAATPTREAGQEHPTQLLAGGLKEPARRAGLDHQVEAHRIVDLLRADADWLTTATTPAQKAKIEGRDPRQPKGAVWTDTPEGRQQDRAKKDAALRRHEELWGTRPA